MSNINEKYDGEFIIRFNKEGTSVKYNGNASLKDMSQAVCDALSHTIVTEVVTDVEDPLECMDYVADLILKVSDQLQNSFARQIERAMRKRGDLEKVLQAIRKVATTKEETQVQIVALPMEGDVN